MEERICIWCLKTGSRLMRYNHELYHDECYSDMTTYLSTINWKKDHPEYQHPYFPEELLNKSDLNPMDLKNWESLYHPKKESAFPFFEEDCHIINPKP